MTSSTLLTLTKAHCEGNKSGCQLCSEKKLSCVYGDSRVGKLVGKRRKLPLQDAISNVDSGARVTDQWRNHSVSSENSVTDPKAW